LKGGFFERKQTLEEGKGIGREDLLKKEAEKVRDIIGSYGKETWA